MPPFSAALLRTSCFVIEPPDTTLRCGEKDFR